MNKNSDQSSPPVSKAGSAQALNVSADEIGYLRLYFAIFGIELSEVLDVRESAA